MRLAHGELSIWSDRRRCAMYPSVHVPHAGLPNERLFFEIYAQALRGRPGTAGLLDDIVDAWIVPLAEYAVRWGSPPEAARADARLGVAVCRGLLLDLLATGDRAAVDAALERYIAQYEAARRTP
jgi:hypothetical protein